MTRSIDIPTELARDRGVRQLITSWVHLHSRYRICAKRVNWRNRRASAVEKKRRREKWRVVARILEIERSLIRMVAKQTRHPDIWMSKKADAPESLRAELHRRYEKNRRETHHLRGETRAKAMRWRVTRVREIRELDRKWMVAILKAVHPHQEPPKPITLHPRELTPRKLKRASVQLTEELAS